MALATELLQRVRLADPDAGLWEAADVQWWWRKPRASDEVEQCFWADDSGPVAAVLLTEFGAWQCDPIVVPDADRSVRQAAWARVIETLGERRAPAVEVPVRDDDAALVGLLERAGLVPTERSGVAWIKADDRPELARVPEGFTIVEPMRVEAEYWRRGLARAMLTSGLDRLAVLGAHRIKVGYSTDAARALYESVGFRTTATTAWYAAPSS